MIIICRKATSSSSTHAAHKVAPTLILKVLEHASSQVDTSSEEFCTMVMVMFESVPKVLVPVGAVIALPLSVPEMNQRIEFTFLATTQCILCIFLHLHPALHDLRALGRLLYVQHRETIAIRVKAKIPIIFLPNRLGIGY